MAVTPSKLRRLLLVLSFTLLANPTCTSTLRGAFTTGVSDAISGIVTDAIRSAVPVASATSQGGT